MKVALLDAHDANYDAIAAISDPNRVAYCGRHGLDFIRYSFGQLLPVGRQPNWGKIQGLIKHLPDYDWIFYLDTDAVITNFDIDIRDDIDDNYDLIAGIIPSLGEGHLSTGAFLVKNCPWSLGFLYDLWNQTRFINEGWTGELSGGDGKAYWEQSAFHYLYDTRPDYRERIKVVSRVNFNSQIYFHEPHHFLVHFPGRQNKQELMELCVQGKYEEAKRRAIEVDEEVKNIYARAALVKRAPLLGRPKLRNGA